MADVTNLGTGGSTLDARYGSTSGADTNDPRHLPHTGSNYVYLPGVATNVLTVPAAGTTWPDDGLDVSVRVAMDDWTPAADGVLVGRYGSTTADGHFYFLVRTSGTLQLVWRNDAETVVTATSTAAPTVTDGSPLWVRVVLNLNDGGVYTVKFYTAADSASVPSSWTQLGNTVSGATATSLLSGGAASLVVGARGTGSTSNATGIFHRAIVKNGIDGTTVLDVDTSVITSGAATSFTATTGQTVTINRGASGRKTVAVTAPCWLFGTDDYLEVPDDPLLDFAAGESFTVLVAHRARATFGTSDALAAKKADTTAATQGWALTAGSSTAARTQLQVGDGAAGATAVSGSRTSGAVSVVAGVRDTTADTLTVYLNGTAGTPVTDTTTSSSANAEVLRIGRLSGAGTEYADMELMAAAVWRRALTAAEISALSAYFATRWP